MVHMLSQQIECACRELGVPLHSGVVYGSTAELEVSANKYGVHFTQWVLSLPRALRYKLAYDAKLITGLAACAEMGGTLPKRRISPSGMVG